MKEWCGMLVDFDWAGPVGETKYLLMLSNMQQIKWADGVAPLAQIKMEHDLDMLEKLNHPFLTSYHHHLLRKS